MNQRIRVNELDAAGGRNRLPPVTAHGFGARKTQDRTQSFAAGADAVTHRIGDGRWTGRRRWQRGEKGLVNRHSPGAEILLKIVRAVHRRARPSLSSSLDWGRDVPELVEGSSAPRLAGAGLRP